eukprot:GHVN01087848.1.p2 GENE.GHVN01087848.1~~GHVN01087848.1.p2  ORF type:complete len:778 (+),score=57.51 GHVN01087848.1:4075-6408(+)
MDDFLDEKLYEFEDDSAPRAGLVLVDDDEILQRISRKRETKERGKKRSENVLKKMGEANIAFVCKDHEKALSLLKDVVFEEPEFAEAYDTLGLIHEELGDKERAVECIAMSARLGTGTAEKWKRLTEMALNIGKKKVAVRFLSRAITLDPADEEMIFQRAMLCVELKKHDLAIKGLLALFKRRPRETRFLDEFMQLVISFGVSTDVLRSFEAVLDSSPNEITFQHLQILFEGYQRNKAHRRLIEAYQNYAKRAVQNMHSEKGMLLNDGKKLKREIPFIFRKEYTRCLIKEGCIEEAMEEVLELDKLFQRDEDVSDLLKMLVDFGYNQESLYLLSKTKTTLRRRSLKGKCCQRLSFLSNAEDEYRGVLNEDPGNEEAIVGLGTVLVQKGEVGDGLRLVSSQLSEAGISERKSTACEPESLDFPLFGDIIKHKRRKPEPVLYDEASIRLMYEKIILYEGILHTQPIEREILWMAEELLRVFFESNASFSDKKKLLARTRVKPEEYELRQNMETIYGLSKNEWLRLMFFYSVGTALSGNTETALGVIHRTMESNLFYKDDCSQCVSDLLALGICMVTDSRYALSEACARIHQRHSGWFRDNIFCFFMTTRREIRQIFSRKMQKRFGYGEMRGTRGDDFLRGMFHIAQWNYPNGIRMYRKLLDRPDSLIFLSLGTSLLVLGVQKKTTQRRKVCLEGLGFLFRYYQERSKTFCFEACYNLARAFHQLGLLEFAIDYYRRALDSASNDTRYVFECGYNLSRLLMASKDTWRLGRCVFEKYCVL